MLSPSPSTTNHTHRRLIITGSDSRYFPLLQEMIASIRRFPTLATLDIACIDGGLTDEQRTILGQENIIVRTAHDFPHISQRALRKRPNLAIELSKMWLNRLFPDWDTLLWIDADAWVQQSSAVELLFSAAEQKDAALAIIPEIFLHKPFRLRWLPFGLAQPRSILYKNARIARLPRLICRAIGPRPTLNGGIFALAQTAPHWQTLQAWQKRALKHGKIFSSGQLALALTSYYEGYKTAFMPTSCNYLGPWLFDENKGLLCEGTYPHHPAGIIHMAGYDAMRLDPNVTIDVPTIAGGTHPLNLRFSVMRTYHRPNL